MALNVTPVKVNVRVPKIYRNEERLRLFQSHMRKAHHKIVRDSKGLLRTAIRVTRATATRTLLRSVSAKMTEGKSFGATMFESEVGFTAPGSSYAFFANYGRDSGGFPPWKPIAVWMRAKGIPEKHLAAIVHSIGTYGTEGHGFLELATEYIRKNNQKVVREAIQEFKSAIRSR